MKKFHFLIFSLFLPLIFSGCYEHKVQKAVEKLKVGQTIEEMKGICSELKYLKQLTLLPYKYKEAKDMNKIIGPGGDDQWFPNNLFTSLSYEGNMAAYTYLIKREKRFANPVYIDYLAIFVDQNKNEVIGWAKLDTLGDVDSWDDEFIN